ncbi:hypothetical protein GOBAR_DD04564 [Gossypium barbadense]|nr:hypothetical protein GOBAR_DD04564 [Gossypium barbadense]
MVVDPSERWIVVDVCPRRITHGNVNQVALDPRCSVVDVHSKAWNESSVGEFSLDELRYVDDNLGSSLSTDLLELGTSATRCVVVSKGWVYGGVEVSKFDDMRYTVAAADSGNFKPQRGFHSSVG